MHAAIGRKEARTVASRRFAMRVLRQAQRRVGAGKEVGGKLNRRMRNARRKLALEFIDRARPAEPAGTADRKQASSFRLKHHARRQRNIPKIGLVSLRGWIATGLDREQILWPAEQAFGRKEARDQLAFLARHTKQDRERFATHAQFKRLLDRDPIFGCVDHNARGPGRKARDMHGTGERGR
jgi:hypothetical protein